MPRIAAGPWLLGPATRLNRGPPGQSNSRGLGWCSWAREMLRMAAPWRLGSATVCSVLCRRWASIRLKCMDSWIQTWADRSMFGGFKQRATEEEIGALSLD
eukprot:1441156-Alexandrium_andersonii.AAC.1